MALGKELINRGESGREAGLRGVGWLALLLASCIALPLCGQSQSQVSLASFMTPSAASTQLYFAQLTDGGGWATSLFFSNPNQLSAATVSVSFYNHDGQPLLLDFGTGPASTLSLTVPAGGMQTVTSKGAGTSNVSGWAFASASIPLVGTLMYRFVQNGKPVWDVAAGATSPTYYYYSYATPQIGVAIDNPSATQTIHVTVAGRDSTGAAVGNYALTLAPLAHQDFNLSGVIGNLPDSFKGSITITTADTPFTPFIAYTIGVRDGLLAPLPPGELRSPAPTDRLLADAAALVKTSSLLWVPTAATYGDFNDQATAAQFLKLAANLTVQATPVAAVAATYKMTTDGVQISVSRPLLETLADSKAAVAFLVAHYLVRATIDTSGNPSTVFKTDPAGASDLYALITVMMADLDPSGMVDFYGRLEMALAFGLNIDSSLQSEFLLTGSAYHARIGAVWKDLIVNGCAQGGQQACGAIHELWHPDYPSTTP